MAERGVGGSPLSSDGHRLAIKVTTGAKKSEILGVIDGSLALKIAARPIEGAANRAVIEFLAKTLRCSKSSIRIERGETSRHKLIAFDAPVAPEMLGLE
jgi:uncharacterized protein (TIGR00251 family)